MQGLWLQDRELTLRNDLPLPEPAPNEARIRVLRAGICNTDLELLRGYYPYQGILGHEFVGVVDRGPEHLLHQRVVGEINAACGQCDCCQRGMPTHCRNRSVLGIVNHNGAFADYLCLPVQNLHIVPDTISTEAATFTEPLAAALEILEQVTITPNDRVLVVGDGKLGQLVAQTLALTGCELLTVGRHADKLANLSDRGIATALVTAATANSIASGSYDIAVECTGNPSGFETARRSLRPRGTLVLKSTYAGQLSLDMSAIVVDELTIVGSRCGPFAPALDLLALGKVDVTPLIQARYPLSQGLSAFDQAQQKGTLKVLLEMGNA
ncbi:MDR/zinc-dependent alcohol dehydrogenase-like family protein [Alkalinema pantanalense CENA528]|uniref:MDR/zinc-dependent alcohol dehydrogenase-like family protein n=1 Tax=Alkalinema pantanalense TaxID=1620705 RepID=UPI003D6F6E58